MEELLRGALGVLVPVVEACGAAVIVVGALWAFVRFVVVGLRDRDARAFVPVRLTSAASSRWGRNSSWPATCCGRRRRDRPGGGDVTGTLHGAGVALAPLATAAALLAGLVALVATRRPAVALPVFLDLLVAAGLLRLVGEPGGQALATAASIILLRRLIGFGLRTGGRTWVATRPDGSSRVPDLRRLVRPAWRA